MTESRKFGFVTIFDFNCQRAASIEDSSSLSKSLSQKSLCYRHSSAMQCRRIRQKPFLASGVYQSHAIRIYFHLASADTVKLYRIYHIYIIYTYLSILTSLPRLPASPTSPLTPGSPGAPFNPFRPLPPP